MNRPISLIGIDREAEYATVLEHTEYHAVLVNDRNEVMFLPMNHPALLPVGCSEDCRNLEPVCSLDEYKQTRAKNGHLLLSADGKTKRLAGRCLDLLREESRKIKTDESALEALLRFCAALRILLPLRTAVLTAAQRPKATEIAPVREWQARNTDIRGDAEPIYVLLSQQDHNGRVTYRVGAVYDIADTVPAREDERRGESEIAGETGEMDRGLGVLVACGIGILPCSFGGSPFWKFASWKTGEGQDGLNQCLRLAGKYAQNKSSGRNPFEADIIGGGS